MTVVASGSFYTVDSGFRIINTTIWKAKFNEYVSGSYRKPDINRNPDRVVAVQSGFFSCQNI